MSMVAMLCRDYLEMLSRPFPQVFPSPHPLVGFGDLRLFGHLACIPKARLFYRQVEMSDQDLLALASAS